MPGITVQKATIEALSGVEITEADWAAVSPVVMGALSSAYSGNIASAEGRAQLVLNAVYTAVALRLFTNPTGARSVSLGDTSVTTGGSDAALASPLSLSPEERKDLRRLKAAGPSYVKFTTLSEHQVERIDGPYPEDLN